MIRAIFVTLALLVGGTSLAGGPGTEPNFIVDCYRHCDSQRGACNGRCSSGWYPECNYARCQAWYRICLQLCNEHIVLDSSEPPSVDVSGY